MREEEREKTKNAKLKNDRKNFFKKIKSFSWQIKNLLLYSELPKGKTNNLKMEGLKMKVYKEVNSYSDFDFWSGARDTVKYLTAEEIEEIFSMLEDIYPEGMEETEVNDFFWFEDDTIAEWLGYSSFEEIMERGEQ